jgi:predicted dienelactone hydrolase
LLVVASLRVASPAWAGNVGYQHATIPDPDDRPLEVGIWYPTDAPASPQPLELFTQTVATDAAVAGDHLPVVLLSHGTGGSFASNYDTAMALAASGFVAVSVTHTGDNWHDGSYVGGPRQVLGRPRHLKLALDFVLERWPDHARLDGARVGLFGHSAGGFTGLVVAGGVPDLGRMGQHCADHPDAWDCSYVKAHQQQNTAPPPAVTAASWLHDPRVKALFLAAPAIGFAFTKDNLAAVRVPVEIWAAEDDRLAPAPWNADAIRRALPLPAAYHEAPRAGHFDFLAPCSRQLAAMVPAICEEVTDGFDRLAFHEALDLAVVQFFTETLAAP